MKKHFIGKFFCLIMAVAVVFGIAGCTTGKPNNTQGTTYTVTFDVQGHGAAPKTQAVTRSRRRLLPKTAGPLKAGTRKRAVRTSMIFQPKR